MASAARERSRASSGVKSSRSRPTIRARRSSAASGVSGPPSLVERSKVSAGRLPRSQVDVGRRREEFGHHGGLDPHDRARSARTCRGAFAATRRRPGLPTATRPWSVRASGGMLTSPPDQGIRSVVVEPMSISRAGRARGPTWATARVARREPVTGRSGQHGLILRSPRSDS